MADSFVWVRGSPPVYSCPLWSTLAAAAECSTLHQPGSQQTRGQHSQPLGAFRRELFLQCWHWFLKHANVIMCRSSIISSLVTSPSQNRLQTVSWHSFCGPCVCGVWGIKYDHNYCFWGFNGYTFVDLVKCCVLTLAGEIQCYRNDRYYCLPWDLVTRWSNTVTIFSHF